MSAVQGRSVQELRRERDTIRLEMERVVRQMQSLEAELDAKRPGADEKRAELGTLRQQLADLRRRMRQVMDAASAQEAASSGQYNPNASSGAQGGAYSSTPRGYSSVTPSRTATSGSAPPPATAVSNHVSPVMLGTAGTSERAESSMRQLQHRHEREREALDAEVARLQEAMRRRQQQEVESLSERLRVESQRMAEYEEARVRMERAREELEALNSQPSVLDHDPFVDGGPPELRQMQHL